MEAVSRGPDSPRLAGGLGERQGSMECGLEADRTVGGISTLLLTCVSSRQVTQPSRFGPMTENWDPATLQHKTAARLH